MKWRENNLDEYNTYQREYRKNHPLDPLHAREYRKQRRKTLKELVLADPSPIVDAEYQTLFDQFDKAFPERYIPERYLR